MAVPQGSVQQATVIGGGVIGAGWAARFVLNGIDVALFDPDPDIACRLDAVIANAHRAWDKAGWPVERQGAVSLSDSVPGAVADADIIQESLPERLDLKRRVLGEIDAAAPPDALIASSTSGLLPGDMVADMTGPERFVVAHPFNPVYLMPLVEIVGGEKTAAETLEKAEAFYAGLGMTPLVVRHEVPGFIADRLMEAMWREALHLVNDGHATAVLRPGSLVRGRNRRPFLAEADRSDPVGIDAKRDKIFARRIRPALAQGQVVLAGATLIGMTFDDYLVGRISLEPGRPLLDRGAPFRL